MLVLPRVAHEDGAVLAGLEDTKRLAGHGAHAPEEAVEAFLGGEVAGDAVAGVLDDARVGRVRGDQVYSLVLDGVEVAGVAAVELDVAELTGRRRRR